MAEKAVHQVTQDGKHDIETLGHSKPGPSILETAILNGQSQTTHGPNAVDTNRSAESTTESISQIVVDLRPVVDEDSLEATIDLRNIREVPVVLDLDALESITLPRSSGDTSLRDFDHGDPVPLSVAEWNGQSVETAMRSVIPLTGLAVASRTERAAKRVMDITISLLAIATLLPFMVLIALLVKTTSRGPVLYRSRRIGHRGVGFTFLKFRSMCDGAENDLTSLNMHNEQSGPAFKMKADPRVTPFGRFLRKASIDELPQLIHVLSGKMSLVGPRPALPDEVAQYDIRASQRLTVKPGITCTWQVSGRSELDFDTWIDMDVDYIRSWTLLGDMKLLVRTIPAVLTGRGAY